LAAFDAGAGVGKQRAAVAPRPAAADHWFMGVFFGRIIQAAVSRQREFLADASSVQFTRNPGGITGALKKIGGLGESGSLLANAHAGEASHMFFADGVSEPLASSLRPIPRWPIAFARSNRTLTANFLTFAIRQGRIGDRG
jgi:Zn-dependent protease with chaperone function